jgi:hypothetical protein
MDLAHHVPPRLRPDATWEEDEAGELLDRYRPDYWLSGHIHNLPYMALKIFQVTVDRHIEARIHRHSFSYSG